MPMLLHPSDPLTHAAGWVWDPSVLIGLAVLALGYALVVGPLRRRFSWGEPVPAWQQAAFYAGIAVVFAALVSPLDSLSDEFLFSAHMGQHLLLMLVAPPLWVLSVPGWLIERVFPEGKRRQVFDLLTHPLVAFTVFSGTMWAWHMPSAYDAALAHEWLHIIEHVSFMATAVIGWWPALGYRPQGPRLKEPQQVLYLFGLTFPCTALAALITLSGVVLYPFYGNAPLAFGMTPLADQQLGGLLMWLPGDMILMSAAIVAVLRWLEEPGAAHQPTG